jgi:hypothetical protein
MGKGRKAKIKKGGLWMRKGVSLIARSEGLSPSAEQIRLRGGTKGIKAEWFR